MLLTTEKYQAHRSQIKSGDAVFMKPNNRSGSLLDKAKRLLIQLWTKSEYTHCGFVIKYATPSVTRLMLCDMTKNGCCLTPLSEVGDFWFASAPRQMKESTGEWVLSKLGKLQYSELEAAFGGLGILGPSENEKSMCAELLRDMQKKDGYKNLPSVVTPESLRIWCINGWGE